MMIQASRLNSVHYLPAMMFNVMMTSSTENFSKKVFFCQLTEAELMSFAIFLGLKKRHFTAVLLTFRDK